MLPRREFLHPLRATAAGVTLFPRNFRVALLRPSLLGRSRIEIVLDEPLGSISPTFTATSPKTSAASFTTASGSCENVQSPQHQRHPPKISRPHAHINPSVVRFLEAGFADSYDWRDGIGRVTNAPAAQISGIRRITLISRRPPKYDPNQFGTNEFAQFCKQTNRQPALSRGQPAQSSRRSFLPLGGIIATLPPASTTLADTRRSHWFPIHST